MTGLLNRLQEGLRDRYRVEREIGRGGMATVYLATDLRHSRPVAIKVLLPDLAAAVGHERFLREIDIAAKLQHPHVLPVYDSGEANGLLYYVMPFVEGESLRERLEREGALPPDDALLIAQEVASALDYAHRQGIVHRDVKPANILISDGHAMVADFGIARAITVSGGAGLTQAGMAIGTPSYMSPEQALGETELDGRTDIYALGCVLFEMFAGSPPFEGTTPQAIVAQTISGAVPKLPAPVSRLQPVIDRAMAKEPNSRFETAGEFRAAVRAGDTGPVAAGRPSRRTLAIGGTLVVVAVAAAALLWPRGWQLEGDPRHSLIVFPFENKTGDDDRDYLQEASMNLLGLAVAHWEDMRVYDDERTASLMRRQGVASPQEIDFDAAQAMAREARVGTLVLGDIRREGDSLAIEAKVHDVVSGDRVMTEIVHASLHADPRPLFDSLAARILSVSGAPGGERPDLVSQTTNSLEAYRAYLRGVDAMQQFQVDTAMAYLERAVEIDSTFALAYLRMRDVLGWTGLENNPERRRELIAKAQAYSASLPPRLRTLLQFHAAYENGQLRRARQLVEDLIVKDSTDAEAWYQLGEAHFHDGATRYPHPDTLGNIGKALRAFQRSLELDPRYLLAYQHIVDALGNCGFNNPWLCLADSAVYAPQDELEERYGTDRLDQVRQAALAERLATAQAWVDAAPRSTRARSELLGFLMGADRTGEARGHIEALRNSGAVTTARIWETSLLLREGNYLAAADTMSAALENVDESLQEFLTGNGPDLAFAALSGGGKLERIDRFIDRLLEALREAAGGTANGPGGVSYPIDVVADLIRLGIVGAIGTDAVEAGRRAGAWLDTLGILFADDSLDYMRAFAANGSTVLLAYLASRDTTLLSRFLARIDTTGSRTWATMDAHLALARGDTARANRRVRQQVDNADELEYEGNAGAVRAFGWADLLTQLGRLSDAVEIYGQLDSTRTALTPPALRIRSFAERGALYQQLGDADRAIEMYERFVEAWRRADAPLQPQVDRAREAIAALRGELSRQRDSR